MVVVMDDGDGGAKGVFRSEVVGGR